MRTSGSRLEQGRSQGTPASRRSGGAHRGRDLTEALGGDPKRTPRRLLVAVRSSVEPGSSLPPSLLQPRITEKRHQLFLRIPRPMSSESVQPVTELLRAAQAGDAAAAEQLLAVVYAQLHELARARMAQLPPGQTLQPTALVHEAYLRLTDKSD